MDDQSKTPNQLTVIEAVDQLIEFKQKIVDESYEELVDEGEVMVKINLETLEAIELVLYFINTLDQSEEDL